ncbi:MAG TPA: FtsX-like permease family protein [Aridibacter sp.]|nr:FtsX-like permease family protein [Aridibacter sp.]
MQIEAKLAARYFFSGRSRLARFTSLVAVAGIAVGLAGFIVAQALSNGFANGVREKVLANTGHITVTGLGDVSAGRSLIELKIRSAGGVSRVDATTFEPAVAILDGVIGYAVIRAVDDSHGRFRNAPPAGSSGEEGIPVLFGSAFPDFEEAMILTADTEDGQNGRVIAEAGRVETGLLEYDSTWIYVRESDFARLKGSERFEPRAFIVYVQDPYSSDEVAAIIRSVLGENFEVTDWKEANRPLFSALALERQVALWVIGLIVLLAVMNITTTLSLLVKERLPDIAVLRTLGVDTRMLAAMFLFEGWILAVAGILIGIAAGSLTAVVANRFRLISLPPEVYSLNTVMLDHDPISTAAASLVTFLLATAAMAVPVVRAARVKPLDILRMK